jgi:tetratricopeptide (TPR) repeat protein
MSVKIKTGQRVLLGFGISLFGILGLSQFADAQGRIVSLTPKASVLREGARNAQPAKFWMILNYGDIVKPDSESVLEIVCSNGKVSLVEGGEFMGLPIICPQSSATRGNTLARGEDDFLQYLNLRFYTVTLLDAKQVIRWQEMNGAVGYQVQLGTRQETLVDRPVDCPKYSYMEYQALQVDVEYNLLVKALGSGAHSPLRLRFKLLNKGDSLVLKKKLTVIRENEKLPEVAKVIALADIYNEYGLAEQAIAVLETASRSGQSVAIAERMLGNFYLQVGLRDVAELHYRRALALAESEQNLEVSAEAQIGLAKVFVVNGKKQDARKYLQLALANYASLENDEKKKQVGEWLDKIPRS